MMKTLLDFDRNFDLIIQRSIPYLIFPSTEFRNELAGHLDSLCQFYREKNDKAFEFRVETITEFLDNAVFDKNTHLKISYYKIDSKSVYENFVEIQMKLDDLEALEKRVSKLENVGKSKRIDAKNVSQITPDSNIIGCEANLGEQKANKVKKSGKSGSIQSIVLSYLKKADSSVTQQDISNQTGIPTSQVANAFMYINRCYKSNLKTEKDKSLRDVQGNKVNRNVTFYSWVENPEEIDNN